MNLRRITIIMDTAVALKGEDSAQLGAPENTDWQNLMCLYPPMLGWVGFVGYCAGVHLPDSACTALEELVHLFLDQV